MRYKSINFYDFNILPLTMRSFRGRTDFLQNNNNGANNKNSRLIWLVNYSTTSFMRYLRVFCNKRMRICWRWRWRLSMKKRCVKELWVRQLFIAFHFNILISKVSSFLLCISWLRRTSISSSTLMNRNSSMQPLYLNKISR